jgi:hypothetical protein
MQSSVWALLLRQVPPEQHHKLMLVTRGRTEIAIQGILRIDHQFMAIKGRLAGSQDAGRVFFIPYNQIDYLGFQQPLKESEFHEMFDGLNVPAPEVAAPAAPPRAAPALAPEPTPTPAAANGAGRPPTPIKSAVLERFRARAVSSPGTVVRPPAGE